MGKVWEKVRYLVISFNRNLISFLARCRFCWVKCLYVSWSWRPGCKRQLAAKLAAWHKSSSNKMMQVIGNRVQAEVGTYEKIKQASDDHCLRTKWYQARNSTYGSVDTKFVLVPCKCALQASWAWSGRLVSWLLLEHDSCILILT